MRHFFILLFFVAVLTVCAPSLLRFEANGDLAQAQDASKSLPRFASLKSDRVNVRQGPSRDHNVAFVFTRAGLPIEITAEFEIWFRLRDSDGAEGWVLKSLVSGRRTALVAPWTKDKSFDLRADEQADSPIIAKIEARVIVTLRECNGRWCAVQVGDVRGWLVQEALWGVYPNETGRYK